MLQIVKDVLSNVFYVTLQQFVCFVLQENIKHKKIHVKLVWIFVFTVMRRMFVILVNMDFIMKIINVIFVVKLVLLALHKQTVLNVKELFILLKELVKNALNIVRIV